MERGSFQGLNVWQRGKDLAVQVYLVTRDGDFSRDYGLRDQVRRAAVSVPSNIAEGQERGTDKEAARYFSIARASAAEVLTQVIIAKEIGYLADQDFKEIQSRCIEISRMLQKLIAARTEPKK